MVIELAQTTWDNIVKILTGSKVEPEGKPEVKPEDKSKNNNNQSKNLTDADIKQKVANLQPRGRHFKYKVEHSGINGNSSELVTWKRNKDKTLLKTTSGINSVYSGKMYPVDLSEHYSDDGETLLSKDVMGGFYEF